MCCLKQFIPDMKDGVYVVCCCRMTHTVKVPNATKKKLYYRVSFVVAAFTKLMWNFEFQFLCLLSSCINFKQEWRSTQMYKL